MGDCVFVVGDVHGCFHTLMALLDQIGFEVGAPRLVFVGDLVNRGPFSLQVLRWVVAHQDSVQVVLGNHDLHLLVVAAGGAPLRRNDRFEEVLEAPDREDLLRWLRRRPLLVRAAGRVVVHAGLWPGWDLAAAEAAAREVEAELSGEGGDALLGALEQDPPRRWSDDLARDERVRAAAAILTLVRIVAGDGRLRLSFTKGPERAPDGFRPWYEHSRVTEAGTGVVFGHWARLGLVRRGGALCLDSGCVYGGALSAVNLDTGEVVRQPLLEADRCGGEGVGVQQGA